jgi:hypothetical protein
LASHFADNDELMIVGENRGGTAAGRLSAGVAVMALALAFAAGEAAAAETMVRYPHPVWHNGHKVLFHGAWRGGAHSRKSSSDDDDSDDDAKPAKGALSSPHEFIVLVDTEDSTSLRMATELVNAAKAAGLKARAWAGKTSPDALARFVDADGGDFAVLPLDAIGADPKAADLRAKAPLVARLAAEPVVVIARNSVTDVAALAGRPVSFGESGGVVEATAQAVFAKLGVAPKVVHENVGTALNSLAAGKIDALVVLGADESRAINEAAKSGKLHALALPWRDEFAGRYAPARLTAKDLPGLVGADATFDTIGAPFGLIAVDAPDGSARAAQDAPFATAVFERFQPLLGAGADPKWREVNFAADSDWPRLAAAKVWLDKHRAAGDPALESFREAARTASADSDATAPALADKLYEGLLKSGGAQP